MYKIKLPVFEGPFDLLLYLIKKNEIDIYDIPIAQITEEYLQYMQLMTILDLEVAGEFIEMVATLILIKTRMLLPEQAPDSLEEVEDPRYKLTMQLLEYKRFKDASEEMQDIEQERRLHFPRMVPKQQKKAVIVEDEFTVEATLFDLLSAFKRALDNMPKITVHQVRTIRVSIEDQVRVIVDEINLGKQVFFGELIRRMPEKIFIVVTFMAVLDLIKVGMITARQSAAFEDIRLIPLGELSMSRYESTRETAEMDLSDAPPEEFEDGTADQPDGEAVPAEEAEQDEFPESEDDEDEEPGR